MQKEYLFLDDPIVFDNNHLLAVFKLIPQDGISLEDVATELAAESSTGSNFTIKTATPFSKNLNAKVYKINKENNLVYIGYPWRIFDSGGNIQNIITFIAGNIFGMSELKACKLLELQFPPQMLDHYDGPSYTIDHLRNYLKVFDSPIFGTIIKPKIGLTASEYAELCYKFWLGGGHFVKNDEPQADQDFCPFEKMVENVRYAMDKAEDQTGKTKIHSFNVSAADFDTMLKRADFIQKKMKPESYCFLIDGITAGWMAVQTLRRHFPNVFIHFHRAGHGALTRNENPIGFSVSVLTMFARLAGASGIHTGTAGIGKMSGNAEDDIAAAKQALMIHSEGKYFSQTWTRVGNSDKEIKAEIEKEKKEWQKDIKEIVKNRKEIKNISTNEKNWRFINKTVPIISGGLNPTLLPKFLETFKSIDFITTMGAGVHSHPMGTQSGAKAVIQAFEAWKNNIELQEFAKDHIELQKAIEFYSR